MYVDELSRVCLPSHWGASMKLDRLEKQDLEALWKVGCRSMFVGLESANQTTLKKIKKFSDIQRELSNVHLAVKMGFHVETSFIIGFPWENYNDIRNTYALHCKLLKLGVKRSQVCVLCPIPGTDFAKNWEIVYDRLNSSLAQDDIIMDDDIKPYLTKYSEFFTYLGRYKTPDLSLVEIDSVYQASMRMTILHEAVV